MWTVQFSLSMHTLLPYALSLDEVWVELVVPGAVEGGGDVESLAVQGQLQHLWSTMDLLAIDGDWVWLRGQFRVCSDLHCTVTADAASNEHLAYTMVEIYLLHTVTLVHDCFNNIL